MAEMLVAVAVILLISLLTGLVRVIKGPTDADRMMSAQLFGTTAVGILLLLAFATRSFSLVDVALVFALLAMVTTVAFVRYI